MKVYLGAHDLSELYSYQGYSVSKIYSVMFKRENIFYS